MLLASRSERAAAMSRDTDPIHTPSYRLAEEDTAFLETDAARSSRLALEFMRADYYLRQHRINSTVVVFGSARSQRYYEEARRFARLMASHCRSARGHDFVITTGGGPGVMEAANRGAFEAGVPTIGLNIRLPREQRPNPYVTPGLALEFHYFALRKMHFLLRARALVAFPGGFGTMDEVYEALNLVETGKIEPMPILLVGRGHWQRMMSFEYLAAEGLIAPEDTGLVRIVDGAEDAARAILARYGLALSC
jgi:hypothetical protein